ncbi:MAG: hypothetical protein EHM39_14510, partial [Chloroflexi bacterium]
MFPRHLFSAAIFSRIVALLILGVILANDSGSVPIFITGSTAHLRKIVGNQHHVFSVVGDSISADALFLKPISSGEYTLGQYGDLGETIRYFGPDSFAAHSAAVFIGWTSTDVLNPALADWTICEAGESPLECEYRRTRPAVALVMLASIYMNTGRLAEAIDLLSGTRPTVPYPGAVDVLTSFALAVAYDRDEQISLAHATIQQLISSRGDALLYALHDDQGTRNPFVPPEERRYFAALQHEALGNLAEARSEWLAYAATEGAP